MMKLLVVDDTHVKVQMVARAIERSEIEVEITHETNATSARKRLREEEFDLLLIDLQLPDMPGVSPNQNGGIQFFDLLLQDAQAFLPAEILFITSQDGLIEQGRYEVERRGSALCAISESSTGWIEVLSGQFKLAARRADRRVGAVDIAVITALATELDAVLALDYGWEKVRLDGDPTVYHKGFFHSEGLRRTVVAASALRKGMAASSALATKLVLKYRPKLLAMTGICAGVKGEVDLGDVIVGDPTWDWGSGKHSEAEDGSQIFKVSPKQSELNVGLATLCDEIGRSSDFRQKVRAGWDKSFPPGKFQGRVGPMASGASVIANTSIAKEIASQNRDLIAIEMEAFAVMVAAEYATSNQLHSVAIKSVCDFADAEKHDNWQAYAAYTSASFADELFRRFFCVFR
jgi:nucleoside phosphorylase